MQSCLLFAGVQGGSRHTHASWRERILTVVFAAAGIPCLVQSHGADVPSSHSADAKGSLEAHRGRVFDWELLAGSPKQPELEHTMLGKHACVAASPGIGTVARMQLGPRYCLPSHGELVRGYAAAKRRSKKPIFDDFEEDKPKRRGPTEPPPAYEQIMDALKFRSSDSEQDRQRRSEKAAAAMRAEHTAAYLNTGYRRPRTRKTRRQVEEDLLRQNPEEMEKRLEELEARVKQTFKQAKGEQEFNTDPDALPSEKGPKGNRVITMADKIKGTRRARRG
eukprot:gnl/TRDRNA2_/TRDRNA2_192043_c0_seq1.p1 gnl/TRDRNA2_/TRDRNA2_192043_c0~~gnl/TRDRNA2_/TRDRNA2_192043_c0_seq1.p1  ORF type:complete len:278 (-),score=29.91 gnl/TRDRNA2_/TRDRNA2_192043_c0_seq1:118-951(-)